MARDISKLHPKLREKLSLLISECMKVGLNIKVTECVRTIQEQDNLYAKGRTAPGPKVTNAKGSTYSSMHQWGVAFDFCRNDGRGLYDNSDGFFRKVGRIGQSIGLEWGGSWTSMADLPHFQLEEWGSGTAILKSKYGKPEVFFLTWVEKVTPVSISNPYKEPIALVQVGTKGNVAKWVQWELVQSGYDIKIDGDFGNKSVAALKDFQSKNGLKADGICGLKTRNLLKSKS